MTHKVVYLTRASSLRALGVEDREILRRRLADASDALYLLGVGVPARTLCAIQLRRIADLAGDLRATAEAIGP